MADLPVNGLPAEMKTGGKQEKASASGLLKPPPSVFEEPEASSLLDSFGF